MCLLMICLVFNLNEFGLKHCRVTLRRIILVMQEMEKLWNMHKGLIRELVRYLLRETKEKHKILKKKLFDEMGANILTFC